MIGDTAELAVRLKLDSQGFTTGINKAEASVKKLNATATASSGAFKAVAGHIGGFQKNIGRAFTDLGRGASTAAKNIEKMAFAAGALGVGAGVAAVKWAGDFQAQLETINTIAFATPEGLIKIGDTIRKVALDTGQSLDDLTGAYYDLLSAGVKASDAQSVLNNAVTLGIGGLATTSQTVDLLTTAYNAYGLTAAQTTQATDMFAQAIADGKVKADQISETFANVASVAKAYGVGIDQIAASYGFLTAQGVPAAEVTTEMNRAIISLIKPSSELDAAQKKLKINFTEEIRKKGLVPALQELRDYSDKTGIPLISLLGRIEAVKYALQTTGPQQKGYTAELARIQASSGMAAKQAAERQQGLNFEVAKFKAAIHDAGIEIGTALIPKITPLVKQLDDFLVGHREDVKRFAQDLADGFENVAKWVSKLDFEKIGDSLRTAVGFGQGLINAFLSAPAWLQEAVVTGWGLNKLTGGAVQNIMADLTKAAVGGIFQQFLARGAPGNPMYVVDVTGGLGGGAGDLLTTAGKAGLVTAAAGIAATAIGSYALITTIQGLAAQEVAAGAREGKPIVNMSGGARLGGAFPLGRFGATGGPSLESRDDAYKNTQEVKQALIDLRASERESWTGGAAANAVALGTERGIVHSGVFKKAQAIREAGGFKTSREALIAAMQSGKPLGTDVLVTAQAIALAQGNRVRNDPSAQNLKSAAYNLQLLKRAQDHLPADLAAKLQPKIASLEAAINRANRDISGAIAAKQFILNAHINVGKGPTEFDSGPSGSVTRTGTKRPPGKGPTKFNAGGFLGLTTGASDLGVAGEAGTEAVAIIRNPRPITAAPRPPIVIQNIIKVVSSIRDTNTAQDVRGRWGKTPTQVGAQ